MLLIRANLIITADICYEFSAIIVIYLSYIVTLRVFFDSMLFRSRKYPHTRGTRFIFSAMSFRADPLQKAPCVYWTHSHARCILGIRAWMNAPLSPTIPNKKRKDGGSRGYGEGSEAARSFSTATGTRRALSALTCPYVDPSCELSDLTWSSSKRFSRSGPLSRLFFVPKNGWEDPTWPCPPFLCLFLSHSRTFSPLSFFSSQRKSIAHSVAPFNLRRVLCGSLRLDIHPLRSTRERLSVYKGNRPHNPLIWCTYSIWRTCIKIMNLDNSKLSSLFFDLRMTHLRTKKHLVTDWYFTPLIWGNFNNWWSQTAQLIFC